MKDTPSSEQMRSAWLALTDSTSAAQDCPDPERIWEALRGGLTPEQVRDIVRHTASCPACAEAWRLAHDMGAMQARQTSTDSRQAQADPQRQAFFWRLRPLAMAAGLAGLLFLAGAAVLLWPKQPAQDPIFRTTGQDSIRALISEKKPLPRSDCRLKWTPGPDGSRYTVRVTTEDFVQVDFAEGLEQAEYRVPPGSLAGLEPGTRLMWQVQIFFAEGGQEFSKTFFLQID